MSELTIEITSKCYLDCWWCSAEAGIEGKHRPLAWVKKHLKENAGKYDTVRISGGEPTLHPNLDKILSFAKKNYKTVVLLTNGEQWYGHPDIDEYYISCAERTHIGEKIFEDFWYQQGELDKPFGYPYGYKPRGETLKDVIGRHRREGHYVVATAVLCPGGGAETAIRWAVGRMPVHLYRLVPQGRASPADYYDITVTGDKGCTASSKKTITHTGKVVACSCEKEGKNCPCKQR